jgi:hypothetical protein
MESQTSKKAVNIQGKTKEHNMSMVEYARWLSLIEGIELVCKKAHQMKLNSNKDFDWIKPLAFQKYIVERHESMVDEIEFNEKANIQTTSNPICISFPEPLLK